MSKQHFRIGHLAKELEVEKFVIRFWEKEFNIEPTRSQGSQRFYEPKDLETFKTIKTLLYDEGYTIAGAKKFLEQKGKHKMLAHKTSMDKEAAIPDTFLKQLAELRKKLLKLKESI